MDEDRPESLVAHLHKYRHSERPAVQTEATTLTYSGLFDRINATAMLLRDAGIESGDRVLVLMPNSAEHIIAVLATMIAGAIVVPVDTDAGAGRLADIVQQTSPRVCLAGEDQHAPVTVPRISLPETSAIVSHGILESPVTNKTAFIRFTSGSTGHAKGVVLGHAQQLWTARTLSGLFGLDAGHRELVLVPMALSGGWQRVAATLYCGGCVIIPDKPLSVGDLLDSLNNFDATGFFTPPPLVRMLLASPANKVSDAMRHCSTVEIGSAAINKDELQTFAALVPHTRIYVHYGLTECSRAVVLDTANSPDKLATVGRPIPGVDLKIIGEDGNTLLCNQVGQILLRGPQLTCGYWQQPGLNHRRFVDGWLASGDYGFIDEEGFLTLRGRHDDMINCGGHCYFPDEVEQALGTPTGVEQYLVAGIPDPRGILQQVPWAFVVPTNAAEWSPVEFLKQARTSLPVHMVPRQVVAVPRLPLTPSGKPDRRETAKLYAKKA